MKEIEAKFLDIDINDIRKKIKLNGGKKIHKMMLYKRYVFDLLNYDTNKGFVRIRQENNKITITSKTYTNDSKYANENEIVISSSLEEAKDFLLTLGFKLKHYHETIREKWSLGDCHEIAIDIIPGIPSYIELECKNENAIKKIAKILGLDISKAEYGSYSKQYIDYYDMKKEDIDKIIPSLTFKNIDKELKNYIKKNSDLLKEVKKQQLEIINKNKIKMK